MAMWNGLAMGKHTREKDGKIKKQEEGELSTASTSSITYNSKMKSPLPNPLHKQLSSGGQPRLSSIPTTCTYRQNGLVFNRSWKPIVQRLSGPRYSGSPFIWYVLHMVLPTPKHFP